MYDNKELFERILEELSISEINDTLIIYLKNFFNEMDENLQNSTLKFLAKRFKIVAELLTLFEDEGEHLYAAENPNTLPEDLESLARDVRGYDLRHFIMHKAIAANINSSPEILDYIAKIWNYRYNKGNYNYSRAIDILKKIAKNPNTSGETLKDLTRIEILHDIIARHSNTLAETLYYLATKPMYYDEQARMHNYIVKNPNTSAETLKHIYCWGMVDSRLLAQHPNVTGEILNGLVKERLNYGDYNIFREIAKKPKTWAETLDFLSKTRDKKTHEAVARNHNTSAKTLEFLSKHSYIEVLCTIASDARTPVYILKNLAVHKSKKVQNAVANNTNFVH